MDSIQIGQRQFFEQNLLLIRRYSSIRLGTKFVVLICSNNVAGIYAITQCLDWQSPTSAGSDKPIRYTQ